MRSPVHPRGHHALTTLTLNSTGGRPHPGVHPGPGDERERVADDRRVHNKPPRVRGRAHQLRQEPPPVPPRRARRADRRAERERRLRARHLARRRAAPRPRYLQRPYDKPMKKRSKQKNRHCSRDRLCPTEVPLMSLMSLDLSTTPTYCISPRSHESRVSSEYKILTQAGRQAGRQPNDDGTGHTDTPHITRHHPDTNPN